MFSFLFAAALTFSESNAQAAYDYAAELVEKHTPRDAGTVQGKLAANWILDKSAKLGMDSRRFQFKAKTPQGDRYMVNVIALFEVKREAPWVVVVSHFDTKQWTWCPGANDGASTTGLLLEMGEVLSKWHGDVLPTANVMFVWTDGEECMGEHYTEGDGLWGAQEAVKFIKHKGYKVKAVVNIDMLGDKDLQIAMPKNCDETMMKIVDQAAKRANVPVKRMEHTVKDDHVVFMDAGYRTVNLIDFEFPAHHTKEDTMDAISVESMYTSGKLLTELIGILLK